MDVDEPEEEVEPLAEPDVVPPPPPQGERPIAAFNAMKIQMEQLSSY